MSSRGDLKNSLIAHPDKQSEEACLPQAQGSHGIPFGRLRALRRALSEVEALRHYIPQDQGLG